jgi:hypothetical protein
MRQVSLTFNCSASIFFFCTIVFVSADLIMSFVALSLFVKQVINYIKRKEKERVRRRVKILITILLLGNRLICARMYVGRNICQAWKLNWTVFEEHVCT